MSKFKMNKTAPGRWLASEAAFSAIQAKTVKRGGNVPSAGFLDFSAPDASRADFLPDRVAVLDHADGLDVRRERARGVFHDVHTDTAFFLGQTAADDVSALDFVLSANFANVAHDGFLRAILSIVCMIFR